MGEKKEIALVIGTVPGYPDLRISFDIIKTIVESGADILELSASFSDPVADGRAKIDQHVPRLVGTQCFCHDFPCTGVVALDNA